jgi:hypothetical protein
MIVTELDDLRARNRELGRRLAECSVGAIELVETISRLRNALEECIEWFHERADGEYIDGKPVGNAEMKMEMFLREVRYDP